MNLVTAHVIEVLVPPTLVKPEGWEKEWWYVKVKIDSYGRISEDEHYLKTKEQAERFVVGYKYET